MFYVQKLVPNAVIPVRGSASAAGLDLVATTGTTIPPHRQALIPTGLAMVIPEGYYGRIAPRSGFSSKNTAFVNAGVIDSDYRGELKILMYNGSSDREIVINAGDKIAQLILEKISMVNPIEVADVSAISATERGSGGFGSTDSPKSGGSQSCPLQGENKVNFII
jgi:dUTP pyrophosphatase